MRAPAFWRDYYGIGVSLLAPASLAFRLAGALRRAAVRPWRAPVPVLCVGGLVAGGSGKTPVAISLSSLLRRRGMAVHVLARGYGGRRGSKAEALRVDPALHEASEVGDEAPDFELAGSDGQTYRLGDVLQRHLALLIFYPGDNTPG